MPLLFRSWPTPSFKQFKDYIESDPDYQLIGKFEDFPDNHATTFLYLIGSAGGTIVSLVKSFEFYEQEDSNAMKTIGQLSRAYGKSEQRVYNEIMGYPIIEKPAIYQDLPTPRKIYSHMVDLGFKLRRETHSDGVDWVTMEIYAGSPISIDLPKMFERWTISHSLDALYIIALSTKVENCRISDVIKVINETQ